MTTVRPFHALDVLKFNPTNLDPLTETYDLNFYFSYLARWPHLFSAVEDRDDGIAAYLMAKLESSPSTHALSPHYLPWHAHITALTVAPSARRLGLARILSASLESAGDAYDAYFIDLFVRRSNDVAIALYRGLGYSVWRTVENYYCDTVGKPRDGLAGEDAGEDAWDMRKALARDRDRKHVREHGEDFVVMPEDVW